MRALATLMLSTLWAIVVMAGAWRHRPAPSRVVLLVRSGGVGRARASPVDRLGALIRRSAGQAADPAWDRRAEWSAVCTGLALLVSPLAAITVASASVLSVRVAAKRHRRRFEAEILAAVPETIDLFILAAGAGHPVQRSLQMVAARAGEPVGRELRAAVQRVAHGERTADALERTAHGLGDALRPLVSILCASERYGTPLVPALERLAAEARMDRRRRAEEAARRVPIKLLFPLVLCTLPAFALLTVVPLLIGAFGSLRA